MLLFIFGWIVLGVLTTYLIDKYVEYIGDITVGTATMIVFCVLLWPIVSFVAVGHAFEKYQDTVLIKRKKDQ